MRVDFYVKELLAQRQAILCLLLHLICFLV